MPNPLLQQSTKQLEQELSKLKSRFQMAHELKVKWLPDGNSKKSGQLADNLILFIKLGSCHHARI